MLRRPPTQITLTQDDIAAYVARSSTRTLNPTGRHPFYSSTVFSHTNSAASSFGENLQRSANPGRGGEGGAGGRRAEPRDEQKPFPTQQQQARSIKSREERLGIGGSGAGQHGAGASTSTSTGGARGAAPESAAGAGSSSTSTSTTRRS